MEYNFIKFDTDIDKWSSVIFYKNLQEKIIKILQKNNILYKFIDINKLLLTNNILIITPVDLLKLYFINKIEFLLNKKYILIVGENVNIEKNTFIGWETTDIYFNETFMNIFKNALILTYQNDINKSYFKDCNLKFFPIDGFYDELVDINYERTIDFIYYGGLIYERRIAFSIYLFLNFCKTNNLMIIDNYFDIDKFISKSKINIHINSLENLYHIPYAKIIKPMLFKNKMLIEHVKEIENHELSNYITTFTIENINTYNFNYINNFTNKYINKNYNFKKNGILIVTDSKFLFLLLQNYIYNINKTLLPVKKIFTLKFNGINLDDFKDWLIIFTNIEGNKYKIYSNDKIFIKKEFSLDEETKINYKKHPLNKLLLKRLNKYYENEIQSNYIKNNFDLEKNVLNILIK